MPENTARLSTALADRYKIERHVGEGAMATVYLAHDLKHDRKVAYGNPHLIRAIPGVSAFLLGYGEQGWYGNQEVYFDSFVRALTGELSPAGGEASGARERPVSNREWSLTSRLPRVRRL